MKSLLPSKYIALFAFPCRSGMVEKGQFQDDSVMGAPMKSATDPLWIGNNQGLRNDYAGGLDDFMIFDKALSPGEIALLAGVEYEPPPECLAYTEEEILDYCPECQECPPCEISDDVLEGQVRRIKIRSNIKRDKTALHIHLRPIPGVPEFLGPGDVEFRILATQEGKTTEFYASGMLRDVSTRDHVIKLLDKVSARKFKKPKRCTHRK